MKAGINTNYWDPFYKNKKTFLEKKAKPIMGLVPLSILLMPGAQPMLVCKECIGCALGY
jgi:hypothetical protein